MWRPTSATDSGEVQTGTSEGTTMTALHLDHRLVRAELEHRYPRRHRARRDSSLEIMRRTMARVSRQENDPAHTR